MNLLMVGDDRGSWQMRGVQLGRALGARVAATPTPRDWAWADLVILVKRAAIQWAAEAREVRVPVVWDVLDFWAQPKDNALTREALIAQVRAIQQACGASVLIGATRAMADDIGGIYLPHHCRLGVTPMMLRERAEVVGYDGTPKYLGRWRLALEQSCAALGLRCVVNPSDLRDVDVLVSFRDGRWDGWACRQWKSGVKHVNAIAAGRPIVSQPSAAASELAAIGQIVETPDALTDALQKVTSRGVRKGAYAYGQRMAGRFQVQAVARQYASILQNAARRAA